MYFITVKILHLLGILQTFTFHPKLTNMASRSAVAWEEHLNFFYVHH